MTIGELKKRLEQCDDDLVIVTDGYEQGFSETLLAGPVHVIPNANGKKDSIYGRHEDPVRFSGAAHNTEKRFFIGEGRWLKPETDLETGAVLDRVSRLYQGLFS